MLFSKNLFKDKNGKGFRCFVVDGGSKELIVALLKQGGAKISKSVTELKDRCRQHLVISRINYKVDKQATEWGWLPIDIEWVVRSCASNCVEDCHKYRLGTRSRYSLSFEVDRRKLFEQLVREGVIERDDDNASLTSLEAVVGSEGPVSSTQANPWQTAGFPSSDLSAIGLPHSQSPHGKLSQRSSDQSSLHRRQKDRPPLGRKKFAAGKKISSQQGFRMLVQQNESALSTGIAPTTVGECLPTIEEIPVSSDKYFSCSSTSTKGLVSSDKQPASKKAADNTQGNLVEEPASKRIAAAHPVNDTLTTSTNSRERVDERRASALPVKETRTIEQPPSQRLAISSPAKKSRTVARDEPANERVAAAPLVADASEAVSEISSVRYARAPLSPHLLVDSATSPIHPWDEDVTMPFFVTRGSTWKVSKPFRKSGVNFTAEKYPYKPAKPLREQTEPLTQRRSPRPTERLERAEFHSPRPTERSRERTEFHSPRPTERSRERTEFHSPRPTERSRERTEFHSPRPTEPRRKRQTTLLEDDGQVAGCSRDMTVPVVCQGKRTAEDAPSREKRKRLTSEVVLLSSSDDEVPRVPRTLAASRRIDSHCETQPFRTEEPTVRCNQSSKRPNKMGFYNWQEKRAILEYIVRNKAFHRTKGVALWEEMEEARVCPNRSAQSLKEHFRKQLRPTINGIPFLSQEQKNLFRKFQDYDYRSKGTPISLASATVRDRLRISPLTIPTDSETDSEVSPPRRRNSRDEVRRAPAVTPAERRAAAEPIADQAVQPAANVSRTRRLFRQRSLTPAPSPVPTRHSQTRLAAIEEVEPATTAPKPTASEAAASKPTAPEPTSPAPGVSAAAAISMEIERCFLDAVAQPSPLKAFRRIVRRPESSDEEDALAVVDDSVAMPTVAAAAGAVEIDTPVTIAGDDLATREPSGAVGSASVVESSPAAVSSLPAESALHAEVPTMTESTLPAEVPTMTESTLPAEVPTTTESALPAEVPTTTKSALPAEVPTTTESALPAEVPTTTESSLPAEVPTTTKSALPAEVPTTTESALPAEVPVTAEIEVVNAAAEPIAKPADFLAILASPVRPVAESSDGIVENSPVAMFFSAKGRTPKLSNRLSKIRRSLRESLQSSTTTASNEPSDPPLRGTLCGHAEQGTSSRGEEPPRGKGKSSREETSPQRDARQPSKEETSPRIKIRGPRREQTSPQRESRQPPREQTSPQIKIRGPRREQTSSQRKVRKPSRETPLEEEQESLSLLGGASSPLGGLTPPLVNVTSIDIVSETSGESTDEGEIGTSAKRDGVLDTEVLARKLIELQSQLNKTHKSPAKSKLPLSKTKEAVADLPQSLPEKKRLLQDVEVVRVPVESRSGDAAEESVGAATGAGSASPKVTEPSKSVTPTGPSVPTAPAEHDIAEETGQRAGSAVGTESPEQNDASQTVVSSASKIRVRSLLELISSRDVLSGNPMAQEVARLNFVRSIQKTLDIPLIEVTPDRPLSLNIVGTTPELTGGRSLRAVSALCPVCSWLALHENVQYHNKRDFLAFCPRCPKDGNDGGTLLDLLFWLELAVAVKDQIVGVIAAGPVAEQLFCCSPKEYLLMEASRDLLLARLWSSLRFHGTLLVATKKPASGSSGPRPKKRGRPAFCTIRTCVQTLPSSMPNSLGTEPGEDDDVIVFLGRILSQT